MSADASQLAALGDALTRHVEKVHNGMQTVVDKSAADIRARAMSNAPVDTGFLRNSITNRRAGDLSAEIGPTADYGKYVEEGTSRMSAQPYMSPALDSVAPSFIQAAAQVAGGSL